MREFPREFASLLDRMGQNPWPAGQEMVITKMNSFISSSDWLKSLEKYILVHRACRGLHTLQAVSKFAKSLVKHAMSSISDFAGPRGKGAF